LKQTFGIPPGGLNGLESVPQNGRYMRPAELFGIVKRGAELVNPPKVYHGSVSVDPHLVNLKVMSVSN
jgi:hypothetical protein